MRSGSPPSPCATTPATVPTGVTVPSGATRSSRADFRSVTSAAPSGRNATPQGTSSPVTSTRGAAPADVPGAGDEAAVGKGVGRG